MITKHKNQIHGCKCAAFMNFYDFQALSLFLALMFPYACTRWWKGMRFAAPIELTDERKKQKQLLFVPGFLFWFIYPLFMHFARKSRQNIYATHFKV